MCFMIFSNVWILFQTLFQFIHWKFGTKYFNLPFQGELRDLRQFNNALLGKHVWQLHHETDILLHKVFKAKYFPTRSILDVEINPQSSYNWRSIMQAREVICKGAQWRVAPLIFGSIDSSLLQVEVKFYHLRGISL